MRLSPLLLALAAMCRSVHCNEGDTGTDFTARLLKSDEGSIAAKRKQSKPVRLGGRDGTQFAIFLRKDKSKCLQPTKLEKGATFEMSQCTLRGKQLFNTGKHGIVYSHDKSLCVKGAPNKPLKLMECPNLKSKNIKNLVKVFRYKINSRKKIIISGKNKNMVWTLKNNGAVKTEIADTSPATKKEQKIWHYLFVPDPLQYPSASPTVQPTKSRFPSMVPSHYPSTVPSVNPTELPSMSPM
mmetsp:Transcript_13883/g.27700  ORF Transcript_13883/g.27700 Transcript_13883/m.27700 type:complete len:240 (-) Transcript_13883:236-955(-)